MSDGDAPVRLEPLTVEHVGPIYAGWLNDPRVNRFLESRFVVHDVGSTRTWVTSVTEDPDTFAYAVVETASGRHVGNIKLGPIERRHGTGEIGLIIGEPAAWGKGYGTHAIREVSSLAFQEHGLVHVYAGCYGQNEASRRAFEKAGFCVEAVLRGHYAFEGRRDDRIILGLSANDHQEASPESVGSRAVPSAVDPGNQSDR